MKAFVINPLAILGMRHSYNRPLDRHDFDGMSVPGWAGNTLLGQGEARRFSNLSLLIEGAAGQDMYLTDTTQRHPLGTLAVTKDGRCFRYASAGAAALIEGNLIQSAAPIANHLALTSAAQAIGDGTQKNPIVVTPGATAGAANLYAEGMLNIDTTPGNGYLYRISGHAAITSSVAFNLFLDPDDTIQVALTTSSRYGLIHNPFKTNIISATTVTAPVSGWAVSPIAANTAAENYGWLCTRGLVSALINGTPGVGIGVISSGTTAGAVDVAAVAAEINVRIIGRMAQVGVSGKNNLVHAMLD